MVARPRPRARPDENGLTPSEGAVADRNEAPESLSVCLLSYRSDPHSGGQGVYIRYLSRALADRGHSVDVVSGRPYPTLDADVNLVKLPGENVVEAGDRLRAFDSNYLRSPTKLFEWASVLTGGFPEPFTFGRRAVSYLRETDREYDVVHDNQSLCYGLLDLMEMGYPTVATVHHPITVDRDLALADAKGLGDRLLTRRWFRFLGMQRTVVRRLPHVIAVSAAAGNRTVTDFDASPEAIRVVHNGIDTDVFAPQDTLSRHPCRIVTTVSADVPLKGTRYLLEAFARVRRHEDAELVIVGDFDEGGRTDRLIDDLGIGDDITTYEDIDTDRLVELYSSATVAVVPSLYEGFGLPAGEAMACGAPVVATTGGALPEVVGDAGVLVQPGNSEALADAILRLLADPARRKQLGQAGRDRIRSQFCWDETAFETVTVYRQAIAHANG